MCRGGPGERSKDLARPAHSLWFYFTGLRAGPMTLLSRIDLIREIVGLVEAPRGLILNLGCKETRLGNINVDISGLPEVRADALFLPFRADAFSIVVFSEVLEHLQRGTESQALREIHRVLRSNGVLILSTPSAEGFWGKIYWLADPTFWLIGHRHYTQAGLRQLLDKSGFRIEQFMVRGGPRDMLFSLVSPLVYLLGKLTSPHYPNLGSDYLVENCKRGYTIVVEARKSHRELQL